MSVLVVLFTVTTVSVAPWALWDFNICVEFHIALFPFSVTVHAALLSPPCLLGSVSVLLRLLFIVAPSAPNDSF